MVAGAGKSGLVGLGLIGKYENFSNGQNLLPTLEKSYANVWLHAKWFLSKII